MRVVAETGQALTSFGPYVPAVNAVGDVAFTARLASGSNVVALSRAGSKQLELVDERLASVSHPAFLPDGSVVFYASSTSNSEETGLAFADGKALRHFEPLSVGPLGPTCSSSGDVALRMTRAGVAAISLWCKDQGVTVIAQGDDTIVGFEGLPILTARGVVYHARTSSGSQIMRGRDEVILATGERFQSLGRFPFASEHGAITVVATRLDGSAVVVCEQGRGPEIVYEAGKELETLRGALASERGWIVFGTPPQGTLGVYRVVKGQAMRVVGVGDQIGGGTVTELALNAVSVNPRGDLAIRLRFASGVEQVVLDS